MRITKIDGIEIQVSEPPDGADCWVTVICPNCTEKLEPHVDDFYEKVKGHVCKN